MITQFFTCVMLATGLCLTAAACVAWFDRRRSAVATAVRHSLVATAVLGSLLILPVLVGVGFGLVPVPQALVPLTAAQVFADDGLVTPLSGSALSPGSTPADSNPVLTEFAAGSTGLLPGSELPSSTTALTQQSMQNWAFGTILLVWAGGFSWVMLGLVRRLWRLYKQQQGWQLGAEVLDGQVVQGVAEDLGFRRLPVVLLADHVPGPVCLGLWRAQVFLPRAWWLSLSVDQQRDILLHECAHIKRGDARMALLAELAAALWWMLPPLRGWRDRLHRLREELCDSYVVHGGADRRAYAHLLVDLAASVSSDVSPDGLVVGAVGGSDLQDRLQSLLRRSNMSLHSSMVTRLGLGLVCASSIGLAAVWVAPAAQAVETPAASENLADGPSVGDLQKQLQALQASQLSIQKALAESLARRDGEIAALRKELSQVKQRNDELADSANAASAKIRAEVRRIEAERQVMLRALQELKQKVGGHVYTEEEKTAVEQRIKALEEALRALNKQAMQLRKMVPKEGNVVERMHETVVALRRQIAVTERERQVLLQQQPQNKEAIAAVEQALAGANKQVDELKQRIREEHAKVNPLKQRPLGARNVINAVMAAVKVNVQGQQDLVMLTVGRDDDVKEGMEFIIYRGNKYIVKVRVERVLNDMVACRVLPDTWNAEGLRVQPGDKATNRLF